MKIAIIGTGIAGMTAAWLLHGEHELTIYEADDRVGGHTHTVDVRRADGTWAVDTGFIVFNDWTYPNFIRLLDRLGVASQPTDMSFSVQCARSGLEYHSQSLNTMFAQRSNLLRPGFHKMLGEILRFNREAPLVLESKEPAQTLGDYLASRGYSRRFIEHYIVPMGSAIWSADPEQMFGFPLAFFVRFFKNHGMLSVNHRPQWRVIRGGSRVYMEALTAPFRERIRLRTPVMAIRRHEDGVEIETPSDGRERYDHVIIGAHSDQALAMLADPTPAEREVLGAIGYQPNDTVLHTDARLLPRRRLAWASWNYFIPSEARGRAVVTYHMNRLQRLTSADPFCVTLNANGELDPEQVLRRMSYAHPIFTPEATRAQARRGEICGVARTHYCGAYWGYGFHEDGVNSALVVARRFGREL